MHATGSHVTSFRLETRTAEIADLGTTQFRLLRCPAAPPTEDYSSYAHVSNCAHCRTFEDQKTAEEAVAVADVERRADGD